MSDAIHILLMWVTILMVSPNHMPRFLATADTPSHKQSMFAWESCSIVIIDENILQKRPKSCKLQHVIKCGQFLIDQSPSTVFAMWQMNKQDEIDTWRHFSLIDSTGIAMIFTVFFAFKMCWIMVLPCKVPSWFWSTSKVWTKAKWLHLSWHIQLVLLLHNAW